MKKVTKVLQENRLYIILSLVALFVAFLPLFSTNCINGHDIEYHLLRIEALKEGILAGKPFLRVNMLYFGGRGYASSLFYPDFLLYIPAFLRCLGLSINMSYHIFVGVCLLLSYMAMYYCAGLLKREVIGGDGRFAGLIAAVCYLLAQYHLDDVYTRAAVGEFTAMIFLPFLVYGLYDIVLGEMKKPVMLVIGFVGVLLCHTNTTVFCLLLFTVFFILTIIYRLIRKISGTGKWMIEIVKAAILSMLLTAFYYIPVFEQFMADKFQTGAGGFDLDYEKLLLREVFLNQNPALGVFLPIILVALGVLSHGIRVTDASQDKNRRLITGQRIADVSAIIGVAFTLSVTGIVPWHALQNVLSFVQFPWRLFIMATPFICVAAALYAAVFQYRIKAALNKINERSENIVELITLLAAVIVTAIMIISGVNNINRIEEGYYSYSDDYYSHVPFTGAVIGGEWLPQSVVDRDLLTKECDTAVAADGSKYTVQRDANELTVQISAAAEYVDVPFIYYKGYEAIAEDGSRLRLDNAGVNGSIRVYTDGHNNIKVRYAGTTSQHVSTVVSVMTLAALLILCSRRRKN